MGSSYTAFEGARRIASGDAFTVGLEVKGAFERGGGEAVLAFDDTTGQQIDWDLRGSVDEIRTRLAPAEGDEVIPPEEPSTRGRGRPKLGVVAREVTLLPRHWDWLNGQPGGASVALRKLVETARRENESADRARNARDAAYRFMSAMAGDRPNFEEATRALYAGDSARFSGLVESWPEDIRQHLMDMARCSFEAVSTPSVDA